jgi:RHS repeat-associated protein
VLAAPTGLATEGMAYAERAEFLDLDYLERDFSADYRFRGAEDDDAVGREQQLDRAAREGLPKATPDTLTRPGDQSADTQVSPISDVDDPASQDKSGASPQALALPSGEGSVDGLGESFEPLLSTGTATFSLPIQVPPARGRVQPALSFSYNSGGGQGLLGLGWSVGTPSISRQTDKGVPLYDGTDRFAFNGEELVEVAATGYLPATDARKFRPKLEGRHWRFFYLPAEDPPGAQVPDAVEMRRGTWLAQDKDGTRYFFGTASASRIENDEGVFAWDLAEVSDIHGNRAVYEYFRDLRWVETPYPHFAGDGQNYLIAILYNDAADGAFKDRIGFDFENRRDVLTSWVSGYEVRTVRRLASVSVETEYEEGQDRRLVRRYQLGYDQDSYHSLLTSIQLIGNDGSTSYPPLRFAYSQVTGRDTTGEKKSEVSISYFGQFDATIQQMSPSPDRSVNDLDNDLLDVDGDALPDLFVTDLARNASRHTWVRNLAGTGFEIVERDDTGVDWTKYSYVTGERIIENGGSRTLSNRNVQLLDVDGDGLCDMLHMPRMSSYNYYTLEFSGGEARWLQCDETGCDAAGQSIPAQPQVDFREGAPDIRLFDIDNNRLIDVVMTTNGGTKVWLNLGGTKNRNGQPGWGRFGNGFVLANGDFDLRPLETCPLYKGLFIRFSDARVTLGDMNGDGLQDIVVLDRGNIVYWPGRGYGSFGVGKRWCDSSEVGANRHIPMGNSPYFSDLNLVAMKVADVNGDNLADLTEVMADSIRIWLNQGGSSFSDPLLIERTPQFAAFSNRLRSADMNGSGSRDLVWGDASLYRYIDLTGGIQPRLLTTIENGLGKVTTIEWQSSTGMAAAVEGIRPWVDHVPFPVHVVSKVTVSDSMDLLGVAKGVYETQYRYWDPYYDGAEHEFRGFAYAEVENRGDTNSPSSIARTWFYRGKGSEDESQKGMPYRTETLAPDASVFLSTAVSQVTVEKLEDEHRVVAQGSVWYERARPADLRVVRQAYVSNSMAFLYHTQNPNTQPEAYDLTLVRLLGMGPAPQPVTVTMPGTAEAVTSTSRMLDENGNELESLEKGRVAPGHPGFWLGDERYTFTEWAFDEASWIHRPVRTFVTGSDVSRTYNETLYCYDYQEPCGSGAPELGDLTREEAVVRDEVHGDRTIVRTETDYDAFGHVDRTIVGQRQERQFDYGGPKDRFSVYVSGEHVFVDAATTLSAYAEWEPGFGQITRYEDYNIVEDVQAFTRVEYDPLGRVHKIFQPHVPLPNGEERGGCAELPSVQIEYALANMWPATETVDPVPVSSATVFRWEQDKCDSRRLVSVSYVDGLGRVRETAAEAGPINCAAEPQRPVCTSPNPGVWVLSGWVTYDKKGAVEKTYQPFFVTTSSAVSTPTSPEPWPAFWALGAETLVDYSAAEQSIVPRFTVTSYDAFSRATIVTYEDGTTTSQTDYHALSEDHYDENDTDATSPHASTPKTLTRDGLGRLVSVTERNRTPPSTAVIATTWSYRYDPIDDLELVVDPAGNQKSQVFDSLGRKVKIVDPNAGTWTFAFDSADNLVERVDGRGVKVVYTFDGAGRMLMERYFGEDGNPYPGMELGVDYHYDHPKCAVDADLCKRDVTGSETENQEHLKGRLSYVEDLTGATFLSFDARGRIDLRTREVEGDYFRTKLTFDGLDREKSLTYPDGTSVSYAYDDRGLLTSIPNYVQLITYTAAGLREQVQYADQAETQRDATYDARLRPAVLAVAQTELASAHYKLLYESYELDGAGNFAAIRDHRTAGEADAYAPGIGPADRVMSYDALYQLTGVTGRFGTASFAYDRVANLTKRVTDDGVGPAGGVFFDETPGDYTYGSGCAAPHRPYAVCLVDNTLYAPAGNRGFGFFDYDDAGNMTAAQVQRPGGVVTELRLTWDALGRLVYAEREESGVTRRARFGYDYSGARVWKKVERPDGSAAGAVCGGDTGPIDDTWREQTTLYIDATTEVRNCRMTKYVFAGGRRIARVVTEDPVLAPYGLDAFSPYTFFYHQDHLGSASAVTDEGGEVVNYLTYHPYGSIERENTAAGFAPFSSDQKYTDKELDEELGLVYFGARYYWAELGRWVSPDPLFLEKSNPTGSEPRNLEIYAFVLGNVLKWSDPTGLAVELGVEGVPEGEPGWQLDAAEAGAIAGRIGRSLVRPGRATAEGASLKVPLVWHPMAKEAFSAKLGDPAMGQDPRMFYLAANPRSPWQGDVMFGVWRTLAEHPIIAKLSFDRDISAVPLRMSFGGPFRLYTLGELRQYGVGIDPGTSSVTLAPRGEIDLTPPGLVPLPIGMRNVGKAQSVSGKYEMHIGNPFDLEHESVHLLLEFTLGLGEGAHGPTFDALEREIGR